MSIKVGDIVGLRVAKLSAGSDSVWLQHDNGAQGCWYPIEDVTPIPPLDPHAGLIEDIVQYALLVALGWEWSENMLRQGHGYDDERHDLMDACEAYREAINPKPPSRYAGLRKVWEASQERDAYIGDQILKLEAEERG